MPVALLPVLLLAVVLAVPIEQDSDNNLESQVVRPFASDP